MEPPTGGVASMQTFDCMNGPYDVEGYNIYIGLVGWITQPLTEDLHVLGEVTISCWMSSSEEVGFWDGSGYLMGLVELDANSEIVWPETLMEGLGAEGGQGKLIAYDPTMYTITIQDVDHVFRAGNSIMFIVGAACTIQGWTASVYFDSIERASLAKIRVKTEEEVEGKAALVCISPYQSYSSDDFNYLGYPYDLYNEDNISNLFSGDPEKIFEYDLLFIGYYAASSQQYSGEAAIIRYYLLSSANTVDEYVREGGGLIVMAQYDYSWLPPTLSSYTELGERVGGGISEYYEAHTIVHNPNELASYVNQHPPDDDLNFNHFRQWESENVGTQHGIYVSIARDIWFWYTDVTTWIAGEYSDGRVTLTTMHLDLYSGHPDTYGKPFYDRRLALENMIHWVERACAYFSISAEPASIIFSKPFLMKRQKINIIISSHYGFSSPVTLSAAWKGTAPTGIRYFFSSKSIIPPNGGTATTTLIILASGRTQPGSYTLRVTGISGEQIRNVDIMINISHR